MRPIMTREGMTLTRIAVDRRVWLLSKCPFNLRLCSLGNEPSSARCMRGAHEAHRPRPDILSICAVIPDRGVYVVAAQGWRHVSPPEAVKTRGSGNSLFKRDNVFYRGGVSIRLWPKKSEASRSSWTRFLSPDTFTQTVLSANLFAGSFGSCRLAKGSVGL
jgi:hypothetical protein